MIPLSPVCLEVPSRLINTSSSNYNNLFRDFVENSKDLVQLVSIEGRFLFVNRAWRETLGYTEGEVDTLHISNVLPPACVENRKVLLERLLRGEDIGVVKTTLLAKDGRRVEVEGQVTLRTENGQPANTRAIFRDVTRQRQQETELNLLALVAARTHNGILIADRAGLTTWINPAYTVISGYTLDELRGRKPGELLQGPESDPAVTARMSVAIREGRGFTEELINYRKDGERFWTRLDVQPLTDEQGQCTGFMSVQQDITGQREQARHLEQLVAIRTAALDQSQAQFRSLFENAPDAMVMVDASGEIRLLNTEAERTFGWTREELLGRNIEVLIPHALHERHEGLRASFAGNPHRKSALHRAHALPALRKDGTVFPADISLNPIETPRGRVTVAAIRDVTDLTSYRTVERQLEETSGLLEQITENIQEVIWLFDNREQRLLYVSKGYELVWGRTVESLHAQNSQYIEGIHEADRPILFAALKRQALGERTEMEYRVVRPDGSIRWVLDRSFPVFGPDGALIRTTGIAQDITERKLAEQALEANRTRLQRIIECAPVPMAYSDHTGQIVLRNERYLKSIGYTAEDAATVEDWWALAYPEPTYRQSLREQWSEAVARAAESGGDIGSLTCRVRCKDGATRTFDLAGIVLDDGLLVVFVDLTERIAAEEELRKFRTIADQSPYGIAMTTMEGEIVYINTTWQQMCGWSAEELRGQHISVFHHERDLSHVRELFGQLVQDGQMLDAEVFHKRRNGERYPTLMNGVVIRDAAQRPVFTTATCVDITERVLGRTLLGIQNEVLNRLGEGQPLREVLTLLCQRAEEWLDGPQCIALDFHTDGKIDIAGTAESLVPALIQQATSEAATAAGLRQDLGSPLTIGDLSASSVLPQSIRREMEKLGRRTLWSLPARDGRQLLGAFAITGCTPGEPNSHHRRLLEDCARIVAIAISRHRAQQALAESEFYFRSLADSGTALIWTASTDGHCNYFNKTWLDFTGRALDQEIGDGWIDGVHPDDRDACVKTYTAAFEHRESFTLRYRLRRHDGEYRDIDDHGTPRYTQKGEFAGYIGHCFDVTDRLVAERQASRSQRLEAIGQLAGGVAHDMNNALAPILMSTELLAMKCPQAQDIIETVEASANRCAGMVRQLLTFARGSEGEKLLLQPAPLIREIEKIIIGTFPKNIALRVHTANPIASIVGDPTQIHQVLLNLSVNARDAMPHGGTLSIRAEEVEVDSTFASVVAEARPGAYVVLEVEDTGTGISPEIVDRIFDPFFTTKGPDKGTGLGLSTVLGIAKGHQGFMRVSTEPKKGSKFQVYLPAAVPTPVAALSSDQAPARRFQGQGRIALVVDDEVSVRKAVKIALELAGFTVLTASDGTEGLIVAAEKKDAISVVITDIHMPTMDGVQFVRTLRHMLPKVPIVVASGRFDKPDEEQLAQAGVNSMLPKPFTQKTLMHAVEACFGAAPHGGGAALGIRPTTDA